MALRGARGRAWWAACYGELPRITLLGTRGNKGKKKGRDSSFSLGPSQGRRYVLLLSPHLLTLKVQL
jgi:hypothetical protein